MSGWGSFIAEAAEPALSKVSQRNLGINSQVACLASVPTNRCLHQSRRRHPCQIRRRHVLLTRQDLSYQVSLRFQLRKCWPLYENCLLITVRSLSVLWIRPDVGELMVMSTSMRDRAHGLTVAGVSSRSENRLDVDVNRDGIPSFLASRCPSPALPPCASRRTWSAYWLLCLRTPQDARLVLGVRSVGTMARFRRWNFEERRLPSSNDSALSCSGAKVRNYYGVHPATRPASFEFCSAIRFVTVLLRCSMKHSSGELVGHGATGDLHRR